MSISEVLRRLESAWGQPRPAQHGSAPTLSRFRCTVTWGAADIADSPRLPGHLDEFWRSASGARLLVDEDYGQWGLVLLPPGESHTASERFRLRRPREHRVGDLIIGEFRGDSDLLLVRCDPDADDFGRVLVAAPLDGREDWDVAAPNLLAFVETLEREQGRKFWE